MRFEITFTPEADDDYKCFSAHEKAQIRDAINVHLAFQPTQESKSRIKRLRDVVRPQFRLRVGEIRVFYDVVDDQVVILGILDKGATAEWLKRWST